MMQVAVPVNTGMHHDIRWWDVRWRVATQRVDPVSRQMEMPVPYYITVRNNEIISITEQYVP